MPQITGFLAKSVPAALQTHAFAIRSAATAATSSAPQAPCAGGSCHRTDVVLIGNFGPAFRIAVRSVVELEGVFGQAPHRPTARRPTQAEPKNLDEPYDFATSLDIRALHGLDPGLLARALDKTAQPVVDG